MDEDEKREYTRNYIRDVIQNAEFSDVIDAFWEDEIEDDENHTLAWGIYELMGSANIEISWETDD